MAERRKRLIEVAFPLEEVSIHSRHDKYLRHGHISTLHTWWARRPLPACRAFIYASLVDDPETDKGREELLQEIADLASWDAISKPEKVVRSEAEGGSGLTGRELLTRARERILASHNGRPPRLLDPFAGGGAIPLEALRLGCEVEASDLNPVAALILKCTVEYPNRFGQPNSREVPDYIREATLAFPQKGFFEGDLVSAYKRNPLETDVRYWGKWILEQARKELGAYYPQDPDGATPVAYSWSRTIQCPSCGATMPLLRQYWLVRRPKKRVAIQPKLNRTLNSVEFDVLEGDELEGDPSTATTSAGDTLCLLCRQVAKSDYVRSQGRQGLLGEAMTAVVLEGSGTQGKQYRSATERDRQAFDQSKMDLDRLVASHAGDLALIPDEPIDPNTLGLRIDAMGFERWGQLFNARQLRSITTFVRLVEVAHEQMIRCGLDSEYAKVVTTYLGLTVDRLAVRGSNQCIYHAGRETIENEIARGALPPVWDYVEASPLVDSSGSWTSCLDGIANVIRSISFAANNANISLRDAAGELPLADLVITDPPYYAAVDYAGLSDFFYVWLKRSLSMLHPDLLALPLTPKRQQAIMASESGNPAARARYVDLMQQSFRSMRGSLGRDALTGIVFANTDSDAWATLIEGLLAAQLVPDASWPIDTEMDSGMVKAGQARLKTSVWMACRPRDDQVSEAFLGDVLAEMRSAIRERLLYFWGKGIRGADFFISAIGPALSVFGRYEKVMRPDGSSVTVRDFLDLVRRESTTVALEQVLGGADLGIVDPATRQYVTWVWSYSRAPLDAGEAIALCLATGADYGQTVRPHAIAVESKEKSKKVVKLRAIRERGQQDEDLGVESAARTTPLIDQLHRAAFLWSLNKQDDISKYRSALGETRWQAMRTLGQAVAECLPDGDEDRRLINGLMSSSAMSSAPRAAQPINQQTGLGI
jgi:adenine-specific DNA methylase